MRPNPQKNAELVTFTEEILNGKLHFVYSDGNTTIIGTKNERNDKKVSSELNNKKGFQCQLTRLCFY